MSNHLIDVQQIKNVYNTQKQLIKLGLLNIRSLSTKALFVNDLINDHNLRSGTPVGQHLQDTTLHLTSKPILK